MRIGELAERTGASVRSLRYYEEQGLLHPSRTSSGYRDFTPADVCTVLLLRELFDSGFCSSVARAVLAEVSDAPTTSPRLVALLDATQDRLRRERQQIEAELARLDGLRSRWGLDPHTGVRVQHSRHDREP